MRSNFIFQIKHLNLQKTCYSLRIPRTNMLLFNVERILAARGVDDKYRWLVQQGFVPQTAKVWLNYRVGYVKPAHLARLCHLLNCTPNDLFEWQDDGKTVLHDTHALRALKREARSTDVQSALRNLPLDKFEKLGEIIAELGKAED